jgi:hypothetical protein
MRKSLFRTKTVLLVIAALSVFIFARLGLQATSAARPAPSPAQPVATGASDPQQYPMMDMIADKIIQKYQMSTCEQLWQQKAAPKKKPPAQEQEMITLLRNDTQMRTAFINRIAPPIANKMFDCGMIP